MLALGLVGHLLVFTPDSCFVALFPKVEGGGCHTASHGQFCQSVGEKRNKTISLLHESISIVFNGKS